MTWLIKFRVYGADMNTLCIGVKYFPSQPTDDDTAQLREELTKEHIHWRSVLLEVERIAP